MIGRDQERQRLDAMLSDAVSAPRVVVIEGEAGVGKSTLVRDLEADAHRAGFEILGCSGTAPSASYPFMALHELLHPVLELAHGLPPRQRDALLAALEAEGPPPDDLLLVGIGALGVLAAATAAQPVLAVVEDAQRLDPFSARTIAFVARRLPARLLLAVVARPDAAILDRLEADRLRLRVDALRPSDAALLLDQLGVDLPAPTRRRLLEVAGGNPLALTELADALTGTRPVSVLPRQLPTTRRLREALGVDLGGFPPAVRMLALLVAAGGERTALAEVLAAGETLGVDPSTLTDLTARGLLTHRGHHLRFEHELTASAVYDACSTLERAAAHRALADVSADPVAVAWHRAAATSERDLDVATDLVRSADVARARGDLDEAVAALCRAAELAPLGEAYVHHALLAADLASQSGHPETAVALLTDVLPQARSSDVVVRAAATETLIELATGRGILSVDELTTLATQTVGSGTALHAPDLLGFAAERVWTFGVQPSTRARLADTITRLGTDAGAIGRLAEVLVGAHHPPELVRSDLAAALDLAGRTPDAVHLARLAAHAAESVHDLDAASQAWNLAYVASRTAGRSTDEALALDGRAAVRCLSGDLAGAAADVQRAAELASATGSNRLRASAAATSARLLALRGLVGEAHEQLRLAREWSDRRGNDVLVARTRWASGVLALTEGRYIEAWFELDAVAEHPTVGVWALADLADAGIRCGRADAARARVAETAESAATFEAPLASALVARAQALLVESDSDAEDLYRAAIGSAVDAGADLDLARGRLMYGEWLRRHRRVSEAREQLGPALRQLERSEAMLLAERAKSELAAAALPRARRTDAALADLTPQELKIVQLAASGLSNRAIAEQVMLSARTVGAHLYRAFPKLGVTSRAQLADLPGLRDVD